MDGRHLRRGRGSRLRTVLALLVALLIGVVVGAGGVLVDEGRLRVGTGADDDAAPVERGTAALVPETGPVTIALIGDIRVDGADARRFERSPDDALGPLADVLRDADLTIATLEATIVDGAVPVDDGGPPVAAARVLDALLAAGIDVVSVATDHGLDRGPDALYETLTLHESHRDAVLGVGANEDEAYEPFVRDVGGTTVAVLAATQVLPAERIAEVTAGPGTPGFASAKRVDRLVGEVVEAREVADTVVVLLHWGAEGETCPSPGQQELAEALVEAGADVVAGSNARRVQGVGRKGDAVVAYGLGAFLGGGDDEGAEAGALLVEVDGGEVRHREWVPAARRGGVAQPLDGVAAEATVDELRSRRGCTDLEA